MHHKLDIHPIPTDVLYVNELSLAGEAPYENKTGYGQSTHRKDKVKWWNPPGRQCEDLCADGSECRHYYVAAIFAA